jgi:type III restriction enzyme
MFELLKFQTTAAESLIREIKKAQARYDHDSDVLGAVVLEAATGAGKTVIATSVIEQLVFGSDQSEAVEGTAILWVTNDPSLNVQTARKMMQASEKINDIWLVGQGSKPFDEEYFEPGGIYFLHTQAASSASRLAKHSEKQTWTIWETISNTVRRLGSRFIVIVDEAHYGVTERPGGSPTVVNKIINGDRPIPVFVGISATAERLNKALDQQGRLKKNVLVPIADVRDSGLVKDRIVLAPAAKQGEVIADTTFVRLAVQKTLEFQRRWDDYAAKQNEVAVRPALVVQLPDKRNEDEDFKGLIRSVVDAVTGEWPGLIAGHIVHTFAEHTAIDLGSGRAIRYMPPQDIQDATEVRVVLAKNAITTGWDCPRAEVLVSLRTSTEFTPIAQLIGRIVRQPLARRISSDQSLNRVHAFLPRFDRKTVMSVVNQFSAGATESTAELVRITLDYEAPQSVQPALDVLAQLPSYIVPAQSPSPEVKRLHALATFLDNDGIRPGALAQATAYLNGKLDDEADKLDAGGELEGKREAVSNASVYELLTSLDGQLIDGERTLVGTRLDAKNIDDVYKRASRSLKDGTAEAYWSYLVDKGEDEDPIEAKITVAALALTEQVVVNIEKAAASLSSDWVHGHAKSISLLSEPDREKYARLQADAQGPSRRPSIAINGTIEDAISVEAEEDLSDDQLAEKIRLDGPNRWARHLYQDAFDDKYWKKPFSADGLERRVLASELAEPNIFAWYRNPTGGDRALCIPYRDSGNGRWARLFPDFIFFHEISGEIKASIIDPHGIQLVDWKDKLGGYLDYADTHPNDFHAVMPLTEIDGKAVFLAIHDKATRIRVRGAIDAGASVEAIFRSFGIGY